MEKACMVVDYQKGFGDKRVNELYVEGGEILVPVINRIMQETKNKGGIVIASRDEHPVGNVSFASNFIGKKPITEVGPADPRAWITLEEVQSWKSASDGLTEKAGFTIQELVAYLTVLGGKAIMWPDHCQSDTEGFEFVDGFDESLVDKYIIKGDKAIEHPYSAFPGYDPTTGQSLDKVLQDAQVSDIDLVGLATDYCVKDTGIDLVRTGKYKVNLILAGTRAVSSDTEKYAIDIMRKEGIIIVE